MNDRYLYRAKRVDNGEWVEGYLVKKHGLFFVYDIIRSDTCRQSNYEVDTSTICQCTGLKDKNGNLIWENDILFGHLDDDYPDDVTYACVIWNDNGFYLKENFCDDIDLIDETDKQYFEVCGNIFDNPELLQEV